MSGLLAWAVLVPLAGAIACLAVGRRAARAVAWAAACATSSLGGAIAWLTAERGPMRHALGGWGAPLGIELRADGVAAAMLLAAAVVGAATTATMLREPRASRVLASWLLAWAGLDALVLSADIFNLYVALELTTIASVGLVASAGTRRAGEAALRYLLLGMTGSLVYLAGVAVLYGVYATLDLETLGARASPTPASSFALALMFAGLCLKAALFPLHGWLPAVYVAAEPPVAAILGGLLGKGPFYVLLRIGLATFELSDAAGGLLGALGAGAIVWGSLLAIRQRSLTALVAYSSVAQIGYLFLALGVGARAAMPGVVMFAVSHAAAKASLFLSAGAIRRALGHDEVDALAGVAEQLPLTFFAVSLAGVSLMGMPPSGGFVGKWLLLRAAMERGEWLLGAALVIGGLLAAVYVFRILRAALAPPPEGAKPPRAPRATQLAALALAIVSILLGVAPGPLLALLAVGAAP
jgi:multicomponent Na+:H+ antiporter subunit D